MKKTVSVILLLTLLLSLASCGGDGYQTVKEGNVSLRIPDTMIKRNVSYADIYYSNGEMYLMMMAFSNSRIEEELELFAHITVTDYVSLYKAWNGYTATSIYDEERNAVQFDELTSYESDGMTSYEYEYYLFFRREGGIYVICLGCDGELKAQYEEIFKYIDSTVVVN